ncbi:MAG: hypothetical protein KC731_30375 [Myxococcales bacterium]|nr:hypothetical protein [Myxococcales bacterium]
MNRFPFSWALLGALAFAACAFPDIEFRTDDTTSSSGAAPGTGGMGAGPTTGGMGTGATGGDGGQGGCVLGDDSSCSPSDKCTVIDTATGETGCGGKGSTPPFAICGSDADCQSGHYCDGITRVCHPFCVNSDTCAGTEALCRSAVTATNTPIPNVRVCSADCHPLNLTPCNPSKGQVTCYRNIFDNNNFFDCAASGGDTLNASCMGSRDCAAGLLCAGDPPVCRPWCDNVGSGCGTLLECFPLQPTAVYHGQEYGVCDSIF